MASRQFKSTDTSKWTEKYGNSSDGVGSINTSTFAEANETFTGTATQSTGTAGGTSIADNDCVLIHQTQGTGAGAWELNKVTSGGGTTSLTLKYALCNTYGTGAQILKLKQYSSLTINTGQTLTGSTWNGSKGGIVAFLVNGIAQGSGIINLNGVEGSAPIGGDGGGATGRGFKGGDGDVRTSGTINGHVGASIAAAEQYGSNGGSGGAIVSVPGYEANGGDGGNGTAGANGTGATGGCTDGIGGIAVGNASLTIMELGGGGGGAVEDSNQGNQASGGSSGGGICFIIAKEIKDTLSITSNGGARHSEYYSGTGGAGAGGSILLKGQIIALGSGLVTANGGGSAGVGRIHVDYLTSLTGTTSPTLDSTQDASLATGGGNFLPFL